MFTKLTKQTLKSIPLENKLKFVHLYNDIDLDLTISLYQEGEGLAQVTAKYHPGPCGRMLLEQGREVLLDFELREKGIDRFILDLIKHYVSLADEDTLAQYAPLKTMLAEFENSLL